MISTKELKRELLKEHKRDSKITTIRNLSILIILWIVIFLFNTFVDIQNIPILKGIAHLFDTSKNPNAKYYLYGFIAVITFNSLYLIYGIFKLQKRVSKIEEFIQKIEKGKIAINILEMLEYRVTLPFKVKINLFPVTFVYVTLEDDKVNYKLPIPVNVVHDLRTRLSIKESLEDKEQKEINGETIQELKTELYDGATTETQEISKIKPVAEFQKFVESDLLPDITKIEDNRKKQKKSYLGIIIPILLVMGVWFGVMYGMITQKLKLDTTTLIIGVFALCGIYYIYIYLVKILPNKGKPIEVDFAIEFKIKIFKKMIDYINPKFKYLIHSHIGIDEFLEMGFFEMKRYSTRGNDQIIGKHSGVPFQLCDLEVGYQPNFSQENQPDEVFFGQVFVAKFNKSFKNDVYIIPKKVDGKVKVNLINTLEGTAGRSDTSYHLRDLGEKVRLEDPEFSKMFTVYSTNQIEAYQILSPAMMERIKDISKTSPNNNLMISFRNNRVSIANNSKINNFEVTMFKSITKNDQVTQFYSELTNQLKMIDDLKLNINIWK